MLTSCIYSYVRQNANKQPMKKIFCYSVLNLILLSFSNCKKCEENKLATLTFTTEELSIDPYSGNERLTFKSLSDDSIVFPQGHRNAEIIEPSKFPAGDNSCRGDYVSEDLNWLQKYNNEARLDIKLFFDYSFDNGTSEKEFELYFYSQLNIAGFDAFYYFNANSISTINSSNGSITGYYQSIDLGPKSFQYVYELSCPNNDPNHKEGFSSAYYSIKEGLVGFKTNKGKLWYLDNIFH